MSDLPPLHEAVSLGQFRAQHRLDERFGVAGLFPKDFIGLGTASGVTIEPFLTAVMRSQEAFPTLETPNALDLAARAAIASFSGALDVVNRHAGLTLEQRDFAEAGFADQVWHCVYALYDPARRDIDLPQHLDRFIADSLHRSSAVVEATHNGQRWHIGTVSTLYGRCGLLAERDGQRWLIRDEVYACPMQTVMTRLVLALARSLQMRYHWPQ